jgi:KDO2-lipid IV(A) lauroyltransferase
VVAGSNPVAPTRFVSFVQMVSYLLYLTAANLIDLVHPRVTEIVSNVIASLFYIFRTRIRRNVRRNLEALDVPDSGGFMVFRNFSRTIRDFLWFSPAKRMNLESYFHIAGKEHLDRALSRGGGAIIITPHMGPWEIAGAYLATLGYRIHTVALPHPSDRVTRFFSKRRKAWGINDYPLGECIVHLIRALRAGDIVVLLVDRNFSRRGITLNFFGRDVVLPDGHIILAIRTGAALLPSSCFYNDSGSAEIRIEEPVSLAESSQNPAEIGLRCLRRIERNIREHHEQWFAFDHLWPEN